MVRVLFLYPKASLANFNAASHSDWMYEVGPDVEVGLWGPGFVHDLSLSALYRAIDTFQPHYLYGTVRRRYAKWLPDLRQVRGTVKVFVECDSWNYRKDDKWYRQFDKLYCRQPVWNRRSAEYCPKMGTEQKYYQRLENAASWEGVPCLRWSVSEQRIVNGYPGRSGVWFVGGYRSRTGAYEKRLDLYRKMGHVIGFTPPINDVLDQDSYWDALYKAAALVCPTESGYGDFIPAKLMEYLASGAAVITNCNLIGNGLSDLDPYVIHYDSLTDLESLLSHPFETYWDKALPAMANHTHRVRYREIFPDITTVLTADEAAFVRDRNNGTTRLDTVWQRWSSPGDKHYPHLRARFDWMSKYIHGPAVLDVGCSNGVGLAVASRVTGVEQLVGVDVCREALVQAKLNLMSVGVHAKLLPALAESLPLDDHSFDTVLMGEVLEHVMDDGKALAEAKRVLRPGGVVVVTVPEGGVMSADHLRVYDRGSILALCCRHQFELVTSIRLVSGKSKHWLGIVVRRPK